METYRLDIDALVAARASAIGKVGSDSPWGRAIEKAYNWLMEAGEVLIDDEGLVLIPSGSQNIFYAVNGSCSCTAYQNGIPCWHRAAARLVKRVKELVDAPEGSVELARERLQCVAKTRAQVYAEVNELFG